MTTALGFGRGVTPPRSQSLRLGVATPAGVTCAGPFFTYGGLGQFPSRLRHSFVKPVSTRRCILYFRDCAPTAGRNLIMVVELSCMCADRGCMCALLGYILVLLAELSGMCGTKAACMFRFSLKAL